MKGVINIKMLITPFLLKSWLCLQCKFSVIL